MRLVIDGRRLTADRTGAGRYLEVLLQDWALTGSPIPETLVVLRDRSGLSLVPGGTSIQAEVVGDLWPELAWERWGLARRLRSGDVLFAPAGLIPPGWRGKSVLVVHDTLLHTLPDSFPWHVHWRYRQRLQRSAMWSSRILTPSQGTWRDVLKHFGASAARVRVVYPGVDPSFRPQGPRADEVIEARGRVGLGSSPYFLFVGRPSRRRNVPAVVEAFARYRIAHPGHKLVFVGLGVVEAVPPAADGSILRVGPVPDPILRGLLADAQALLYPSEGEGFGLPIVEAMACGCPVITLRRPALLEAAGHAAWTLDHADPVALADAMHALAEDIPSRAHQMSRGFSQAEKFRRSRFADEVKATIREVAEYRPIGKGPKLARRRVRAHRPAAAR